MRIAVAGAGIAGLAAAYRLQEAGHDVTVFEATGRAGGRALLLNRPGTDEWIDAGTQYYHSNYRYTLKLIEDLGLLGEIKKIVGATRFYLGEGGGSFVVTPQRPWLRPGGVGGNLRALRYAARLLLRARGSTFAAIPQGDALDSLSALESVRDPFVSDYIVRMLSMIGGLSEPGVAGISALQIRRLVRIILTTDYISLKGGTARLHAELARRLDVRLGCPVARLIVDDARVLGFVLADGREVAADHVVLATPAPIAAQMLPSDWVAERHYLSAVCMPPAILVHLFMDRPLESGVWTHFMPIRHDGPVQFFVDTQQKNPAGCKSGKATMQAWIVSPQSDALIGLADEAVVAAAVSDLETIMPGSRDRIEGSQVTRYAMAIPQASTGHNAASRDFFAASSKRTGIGFCGDYFSGGYVECAMWSVEREVSRIAKMGGAP